MSEVLKGRAHPLPGINAGASRAPCFLVTWTCFATRQQSSQRRGTAAGVCWCSARRRLPCTRVRPQEPSDIGLFGDGARQRDLEDLL
jgi:hypothetical protein